MNAAVERVALRVRTTVPAAAFRTQIAGPKRSSVAPLWSLRDSSSTPSANWPRRTFISARANRNSYGEQKAKELNQKSLDRHERAVGNRHHAQRQVDDRPWQRVDNHSQPDATSPDPTGGDQSRGRLLTTPTRLLKLILPLPFHPDQLYINPEEEAKEHKDQDKVEPLALLVHPQQPLSYLERLIQAEIPPLRIEDRERLPSIAFRAEADHEEKRHAEKSKKKKSSDNVASYSGLGHEGPESKEANWVRWSGSTEVGDFIRDAARGREFAIHIEGHNGELRVAVPSFKDRTYYMRMRLRRASQDINKMSKVKNECDMLAHKGAHRIAQGGFGALGIWWGVVYYVTFHTEMGWDLVEPVTYLAGLTTIMGAYLWFLTISRDLSYKAAMNITVSRRQNALYQEKGFDLAKWERLVGEANALRNEIKMVASEYDVEWDEMADLRNEEVKEALDSEKSGKDDSDDRDKSTKKDDSQTTKAAEKEKKEA